MIEEKIKELMLPDLLTFRDGSAVDTAEKWRLRREEIKEILQSEIYGYLPAAARVSGRLIDEDDRAFAGKASQRTYELSFPELSSEFSFPLSVIIPCNKADCPLVVFLNFRSDVPDKYYPAEEIIDAGFAVARVYYKDITSDDNDFSTGFAGVLGREKIADSCGKIALWAWTASRVLDFMETIGGFDSKNVAVLGHSRLGKTALLAGAFDERFKYVFSNDSGCSGAALARGKTGENIEDICRRFSFWFCKRYQSYVGKENEMPFDQHFLLALSAPRYIVVSSAEQDAWACPDWEFLCCAAVKKVYELLGTTGLVCPDSFPKQGDSLFDGNVGYQKRSGTHFLSRYDWLEYMSFINSKR